MSPPVPAGRPSLSIEMELYRRESSWIYDIKHTRIPHDDFLLLTRDRARWKAWALAMLKAGRWRNVQ